MYGSGGGGGNSWRESQEERDRQAARMAAQEYGCERRREPDEKKPRKKARIEPGAVYTQKDVDDWEEEFRESKKDWTASGDREIVETYIRDVRSDPKVQEKVIVDWMENKDPVKGAAKERQYRIDSIESAYSLVREDTEKIRRGADFDEAKELCAEAEKVISELEKADLKKMSPEELKEHEEKAMKVMDRIHWLA